MTEFFLESAEVIRSLVELEGQCVLAAKKISETHAAGGSILLAGNGGSFSDALHFSGELSCTYASADRRPFRAISLGANGAAMSAWANDFGYETFFARQLAAIGKPGDVLILISTGGGGGKDGYSANLVRALECAKSNGIYTIGIVGKTGGVIGKDADLVLHVKSNSTAYVQQAHITLIHRICEELERI
jgi:D-sedoheptulose 7-phosphate isomerase